MVPQVFPALTGSYQKWTADQNELPSSPHYEYLLPDTDKYLLSFLYSETKLSVHSIPR